MRPLRLILLLSVLSLPGSLPGQEPSTELIELRPGVGLPHPTLSVGLASSISSRILWTATVRARATLGACDTGVPSFCPDSGWDLAGGIEYWLDADRSSSPFLALDVGAYRFVSGSWEGEWSPRVGGEFGWAFPLGASAHLRLGLWTAWVGGGETSAFDFDATWLSNLLATFSFGL